MEYTPDIVNKLLDSSIISPILLSMGVIALHEKIENLPDDKVFNMFGCVIPVSDIRVQLKIMNNLVEGISLER